MQLALFSGRAHPALAAAIARDLRVELGNVHIERFPDGELQVELRESVRGKDVFVVQPTTAPVEAHLFELMLMADACRRAGTARLSAVVPYFGYARQDRRADGRTSVAARVVADMLRGAGFERVVAVDLHSAALEGFFSIPLDHLSARGVLTDAIRPTLAPNAIVVAPDVGAAKLAEKFARDLDLPLAVVHKLRRSGSEVSAERITGDVSNRTPILVDDMISTAGTMHAAARALLDAGAEPKLTVVATHGLLVGDSKRRLDALPIERLVVTDSVANAPSLSVPVTVASIAPLLAAAIARLHEDRSLADLAGRD